MLGQKILAAVNQQAAPATQLNATPLARSRQALEEKPASTSAVPSDVIDKGTSQAHERQVPPSAPLAALSPPQGQPHVSRPGATPIASSGAGDEVLMQNIWALRAVASQGRESGHKRWDTGAAETKTGALRRQGHDLTGQSITTLVEKTRDSNSSWGKRVGFGAAAAGLLSAHLLVGGLHILSHLTVYTLGVASLGILFHASHFLVVGASNKIRQGLGWASVRMVYPQEAKIGALHGPYQMMERYLKNFEHNTRGMKPVSEHVFKEFLEAKSAALVECERVGLRAPEQVFRHVVLEEGQRQLVG